MGPGWFNILVYNIDIINWKSIQNIILISNNKENYVVKIMIDI